MFNAVINMDEMQVVYLKNALDFKKRKEDSDYARTRA